MILLNANMKNSLKMMKNMTFCFQKSHISIREIMQLNLLILDIIMDIDLETNQFIL